MPYLRIDRFAALYRLTPAEAEVCKMILHGMETQDIADMRATSPITAKNQITAILAKAGVNRRSDLIRLIIRILPPVA